MITGEIITKLSVHDRELNFSNLILFLNVLNLWLYLVFTDAQLVNSKIKRDYVTFVGFSTAAWLQWEGKIT